eukprot:1359294-Ditylum_brightwellii.AAC.1
MKAFHSLFPASLHVLMTLSSNNNAALAQNLKKSQPVDQPRNRNHILSPDLITPTAGKQIGNLIKRFKFFSNHISLLAMGKITLSPIVKFTNAVVL